MPSSAASRGAPERRRTWLLAVLACLAACQPDAPEERRLVALGTVVTLTYFDADARLADAATAELEALYHERGRDWYPWADGELAGINAALAAGEAVAVSPALAALLRRAAEIEAASGGRFNAGIGGLTELWGFHRDAGDGWRPPAESDIERFVAAAPSLADLEWQGDRVASASRLLALDPGGIAKGALLSESAARLAGLGIDDAIIDLGGDLLVTGRAGPRPARIGIRRPDADGALGWLEVQPGEAVMTSGNYERWFEWRGRRYHHVLDPRSGRPAAGVASVTVVDEDPLLADAAATALLVAGAAEFDATCAALGIDRALLVTTGGDLRLTAALAGRVHWLDREP